MRLSSRKAQPRYYYAVVFVAAVLMFGQGFYISHRSIGPTDGVAWSTNSRQILFIEPGGPAEKAGLRVGDQILALDGVSDPAKLRAWLIAVSDKYHIGDRHSVKVMRDGQLLEFSYQIESNFRNPLHGAAQVLGNLVALLFLIIGLSVFLLKPRNHQVLLFCLAFTAISGYFGSIFPVYLRRLPIGLGHLIWFVQFSLQVFALPLILHFFLTFPQPVGLVQRWPRLTRAIYIPFLVVWPLVLVGNLQIFYNLNAEPQWSQWITNTLQALPRIMVVLYFLAGLTALGVNYRAALSPDHKRRMRVIMVGTLVGFVPLILSASVGQPQWFTPGWDLGVGLLMIFMPLSFAYAIIKHRLFDLRLVIRRSLQYALARHVLFAALISPLAFVVTDIIASHWEFLRRHLFDQIWRAGLYILIIVLMIKIHRPLMNWLDRKFFRESYDAREILSGLAEKIGLIVNIDELGSMVLEQIDTSLHIKCGGLLLRHPGGDAFHCVHTLGMDCSPLEIPLQSRLVRELQQSSRSVLELRSQENVKWWWLRKLTPESRRFLRQAHIDLIIPLRLSDEIIGLMILGEKQSEEPYSREDKELLLTVVAQTALGVERARLSSEMAKEEKLKREIEIAQEVQSRLFPQSVPRMATLDIAGVCLPAQGVAGDYYDFLPLAPGRIGIAIGDISGKGISAALLMANLQASLRSQAALAGDDVARLLSTVNDLLYRSTSINNYSTLFYATFDEATRQLTYANAGHNGPLLVRNRSLRNPNGVGLVSAMRSSKRGPFAVAPGADPAQRVWRLETGGMIIGAFESCEFRQETIDLEPGDIVVAYTDGIIEAQSVGSQVFGEKHLQELVTQNYVLTASDLMTLIMDSVDSFTRGAEQYDDMTLVVMKVL